MNWPTHSIAETVAILTAPGQPFAMEEIAIGDRRVRNYVHMPPTLRAIFDASRDHGKAELLIYEGERLSFEAHWRAATAFGRALSERFGIAKGERVAIAMRNYLEWSVCAWGALAIGAVIVPLNAWDSGEALNLLLDDCGAKVAIIDEERLRRLREAGRPDIALIGVRTNAGTDITTLTDLIGAPTDYGKLPDNALLDPGLQPDDLATIFYTSGTTGRSKGAAGTHRNVLTNFINTGFRAARATIRRGESFPGPVPAAPRRILLPLPLFHVTGFHSTLVPALVNGAAVHLMYKWDVSEALRLIAEERINTLTLVPALAWQLSDAIAERTHDVSSVDAIGYGGASAAPELAARMRNAFPNAFPGQGYGATEASSLVAANSHEDMMARPGSVGIAVPCCDVRFVGDDGNDVATGEPGEIWISGPNVVNGYWNLPDATCDAFHDGWYHTGDIGRIDEEGFIFILDRMKDMLIRGGENIYCSEIEDCLAAHPAVQEAAVFGTPERTLGEVVSATVRLRPGSQVEPAVLQDHVRARLAAHKVPVAMAFEDQPLPRNAAGKLLKQAIRTAFLEHHTHSWKSQ